MNVLVRPYQLGDEERINNLFNRVFDLNRPLEQMRWEFMQGPVSLPERSVVAEDGGRIVGFFGSLFQRIQVGNRVFLTAFGVDNAVDPLYRGGFRGLQYRMWKEQMEQWKAESIPFALGFPNRAAYVVGKRLLNYGLLAELGVFYRRLNYRLAVQCRFPKMPKYIIEAISLISSVRFRAPLTSRFLPGGRVGEADQFPPEVDTFWEEFRKQYPVMLVRDQSYLNWRYAPQWGRGYRIWLAWSGNAVVGIAVGRIWEPKGSGPRLGLIMELATLPPHDAFAPLLQRMLLWFVRERADGALARLTSHDPTIERLKSVGFRSRPHMWDRCLAYRLLGPDFVEMPLILDPRSWHTTFGDSDGV